MTLARMESEIEWTERAIEWRRMQLARRPMDAKLRWRLSVLRDRLAGLNAGIRARRLRLGLGVTDNGCAPFTEGIG